MRELLFKEFKLAKHPTMFIFTAFALMMLIPSYPYYLAFMYVFLAVFYIFMLGRENNDVMFTALLPVRKRDAVRARFMMITIMEIAQIVICVPFAIFGATINPSLNGNEAGIEANVAQFGFVFIMYALFNIIFMPMFYKTAYKIGIPFLVGGLAAMLFAAVLEIAVNVIPYLKMCIDTTNAYMQMQQIPILIAGMAIYTAVTYAAYRISALRFEKVDI